MKTKAPYVRLLCLATFATATALLGETLHVKPSEALSRLGEKLIIDASITEVIFEEGIYSGGLHVREPKAIDFSQRPLVIRAAKGAAVLFDGARSADQFQPHAELAGVFQMDYEHR